MAISSSYKNNIHVIAFGCGNVQQVVTTKTLAGGVVDDSDISYTAPYSMTGEFGTSGPYKRTVIKRTISADKIFDDGPLGTEDLPDTTDVGHFGPGGS